MANTYSLTAQLANGTIGGGIVRGKNTDIAQRRIAQLDTSALRALRPVPRTRASKGNPSGNRAYVVPCSASLFARRKVPKPIRENTGPEGAYYNYKDLQRYYAKRPYLVIQRLAVLVGCARMLHCAESKMKVLRKCFCWSLIHAEPFNCYTHRSC
eukprot:264943-Prorocentrum_minimum.AAC.2